MNNLRLPQPILNRMNVSAQPKLSPFRYPGGKTRFAELVHLWLIKTGKPQLFVEPFAGGASIGIYVATKGLAKKVQLIEKDEDVAAVWQTILSKDYQWLCRQIIGFKVTRGRVQDLIHSSPRSSRERALKTLVKNRMGRSGLLSAGSGLVRIGERERGLGSRWYPETLSARISHIQSIKSRIVFKHACGIEVTSELSPNSKTAMFVDPPYTSSKTSAGRRLYRHSEIDHDLLFESLSDSKIDFLMTHENHRNVRQLISHNNLEHIRLPLLTANNTKSAELLISNDLKSVIRWLHRNSGVFENPISKLDFI